MASGAELRRLRRQREWTQQYAAEQMNMSPARLSRKERGEAAILRDDIRLAIQVYELSSAAAFNLWLLAGLLPDPPEEQGMQATANTELVTAWIEQLPYPTISLTRLGALWAWNGAMEACLQLRRIPVARPHIIDVLFADHVRQIMGSQWEAVAIQELQRFYRITLLTSSVDHWQEAYQKFEYRYGFIFERVWQQAIENKPVRPLQVVPIRYPSGMIEYVIAEVLLSVLSMGLIFIPANIDSQVPYERVRAATDIPVDQVFYAQGYERQMGE
ncbi:MAG: helix-turn-helix domain-containing protein [Chloroflexaceae bacterium]|nr:helix-turn-helix domain-containing protein [Chloroflexaceae bacterium]NJO05310.1 helix-turn-helix domain-containing protein [Chloroflexaceae bacterium]